jgi:site-specific DNA-methyltransferase (adenine-specific)
MTPYYEDGGIAIYHGDCREILPLLKRASCHLIVTDPPYRVAWRSGRRKVKFEVMKGDREPGLAVAATKLALRVLAGNRHLYVFGRYDWDGVNVGMPAELIWDKMMMGLPHDRSAWSRSHEYITFLCHCRPGEKGRDGSPARLRRGTVLRFARKNSVAVRHPAEKPVGLLRELIEISSRMGETVLDYFAGIGSTLVAARLEGRRAIGIEIEERWCEIAAERLRAGDER